MKNNPHRFLTTILSALCLVLSSCGDDEKKRKENEFFIDELSVVAGDVYLSQGMEGAGGNDSYALIVTSTGISTFTNEHDADDFKGDGHVLYLVFKNDITAPLRTGTYTFDSDGVSPAFTWGAVNFLVDDNYVSYALVKSGTVKISKSGSNYTITYSLVMEWSGTEIESTVTGYYSGKLKPAYILF